MRIVEIPANRAVTDGYRFDLRRAHEEEDDDGRPRGWFEGYMSVFGNEDSYGTIFDSGAFSRTIKAWRGGKWPICNMHDFFEPIGLGDHAEEDKKGVFTRGWLNLDVAENGSAAVPGAHAVWSNMKRGISSGMSFMFVVDKDEVDDDHGKQKRHIKEVRVFEQSITTTGFQANALAKVTKTRSVEEWLAEIRMLDTNDVDALTSRLIALRGEIASDSRLSDDSELLASLVNPATTRQNDARPILGRYVLELARHVRQHAPGGPRRLGGTAAAIGRGAGRD